MNKTFLKGLVTKVSENKYRVIASTASVDRQGDVIVQSGWDLKNYMLNPVMLWAHDYSELPVAKCTDIGVKKDQLIAEFEFATAEMNPKAAQIKALYDNGFLNAVSVGFMAKDANGGVILEAELLEISFVPVPANQDALRLAVDSKSLDISLIEKDIKGDVATVLYQEEAYEAKCEKWEEVIEAISAMWTVYFKVETPVEDFQKLLTETIELLQIVVDTNGIDADDKEEGAEIEPTEEVKTAKENVTKFMASLYEKAGRQHSAATVDKMKKALEHATNAKAVLEEMIDSTCEQDGKSIVDNGSIEKEEKKDDAETKAEVLNIRSLLKLNDQQNELALRLVNGLIDKKAKKV